MKRLSPALMAAAMGMSAAISLLMLFAAGVTRFIPLSALCLFVASVMTWIPLKEEHGYLFAAMEYVFVCAVAIVIARRSVYTYLYILLFGSYGIVRLFLNTRLGDKPMSVLLRLLWLNVLTAAGLAFAQFVLRYDAMVETTLPVWALILITEAAFGAFMLFYRLAVRFFDSVLRNVLLPRR